MSASHRRPWWRSILLALACLPTLATMWRAHAAPRPSAKQVLAALVIDPNALVNVAAADMPASPDVLELGRRSTPALARCLADSAEPQLRADCGDMIGVLGDASALPALHTALEDWDESVRLHALRSIGRIADARSVPPLIGAWERDDETSDNRMATLHALGSIASPPALAFLRQVMRARVRDGEPDLRPAAFTELWRNRRQVAPAAIAGDLDHALRSDNRRMIYAAAVRAATLKSPRLVPALLARIDDADEDTRNKVIRALGLTGDRRARPALLARIATARNARLLNNLAFALERVDRSAFFHEVDRLITHKQAVIRFNAAFVVGDVRRPEGTAMLARALADPSDRVRHEAVVAAAKLPSPAPLLRQALGDSEVDVRSRAAGAAADLGEETLLARAIQDEDEGIRVTAVKGARSLKSPEKLLGAAMRDGNERVRATAMEVAVSHQAPPLTLITAAVGDPSEVVRRLAVDGVSRHKIAAALPALQPIIDDPRAALREEAIYAADAATPGGRSDLVHDALFRDVTRRERHRAGRLLASRGDARAHDFIVECLLGERCATDIAMPLLAHEQDPSIIRRLQLAWVRKRADLAPLMVALRPPGTAPLALAQLETAGNPAGVLQSVALLEQLGEGAARPLVMARMAESDLWQRMRLDAALDRLGSPEARAHLLATLDTAPVEWMRAVSDVLGEIDEPGQRRALEGEIARREVSPEYQRALAASAVRLRWHREQVPAPLLDALASARPRERELARRYLIEAPTELLERAAAAERRVVVREELERLLDLSR